MTTKIFDATPTATEALNLEGISADSMKKAWSSYEAKPEYKAVNKHDLIEALQHEKEQPSVVQD